MLAQTRPVLIEKMEKVKEIKAMLKKYRVLGIASLHKVRAAQLQEMRKKMKGIAHIKVYKNTLVERTLEEAGKSGEVKKLKEFIQGSNAYIFTNYNPFKLAFLLEKNKVKAPARAGDIAPTDIIIPAGNTGLPPGPIISQLNALGIPTRIESGSVWISKDAIVAKKGTVIDENLASILSKLGIKPLELGLSLKAAYDDGIVITGDELKLSLDEYKKTIGEAYAQALNLAINAAYPIPETIEILLRKAMFEARNLAINANIFLPEVLPEMIRRAHLEALALETKIQEKQVRPLAVNC